MGSQRFHLQLFDPTYRLKMIEEAELASILNLSAHDSPTHLSQSILAMKTARGPGHFKIAIVEFCKSNEFPFSVKDGIPLRNGYPLRNAIHLVHLPHEPQLRQQPHSFLKPGTLMHSELWRSYSVNLTQYKYKKTISSCKDCPQLIQFGHRLPSYKAVCFSVCFWLMCTGLLEGQALCRTRGSAL